MTTVGKLRNEDFSVFFFIKLLLTTKVTRVVDGYPYTEIESDTLVIPSVSVEHTQTADGGGELGASWFKRNWEINVFATSDAQRDEISDLIYKALDGAILVRDYSGGFNSDTGKSLAGLDLREIEYINPEDRRMRPAYDGFEARNKMKYWRMIISFSTVSTQNT